MIRFPGWAAPWLFAAVFAFFGLKTPGLSQISWTLATPFILGPALLGFLIGVPFWIRDRRRGK